MDCAVYPLTDVALGSMQTASPPAARPPILLHHGVPNPLNPSTTVRFEVATGGTHVRLADAWSEGSGDRTAALAYGTLIHAWFEQVKWLDDGPPSDDRLREVATAIPELALSSADIDRLLADFRAMLARPAIAAGLQRSAYHSFAATLTVETERPIAVRDDNRLLVGNIDRLVTIRRDNHPIAAEIIDFKTDAVAPDDTAAIASKVDFYRPQLSAYRSAVCAVLGLEASQVSAKLLFVRAGIVEGV